MDTYRGFYHDLSADDDWPEVDFGEDDTPREAPPSPVGQDERRMQVRAYNHWASLLDDRSFPSTTQLDPEALPDFAPYSVMLDFTDGIEDPAIRYLGSALAEECGAAGPIARLSDVPPRSLLSRITDHYLQILANQAPIGFEAEFVNQRGRTILYRGILLPFSSDDLTIDTLYGVINWKELADQATTDALLREIDLALAAGPEPRRDGPLSNWADGPSDDPAGDDVLDLTGMDLPVEPPPAVLADWLAAARSQAERARGAEDRSRDALYAAIGMAHDFALAAAADPGEFARLVADAGLTVQQRAPLTPVVKLVFGADYDKTRLTEYATALGHAQRLGLGRGTLADYLATTPGGLKGVVAAERQHKRAAAGPHRAARTAPHAALAERLRALSPRPLGEVAAQGAEFAVLLARRLPDGQVVLLGEVADDLPLLEQAARRLLR